MNPQERQELKGKIEEEIAAQRTLIASLQETSKPVSPDNAIGRLSRMEALSDRAVSEASLNVAQTKLSRLETALDKVDQPDFGLCQNCGYPIPHGRILLVPEATRCVPCAEKG
ncbi:MAG: TraR/DksA C4-type zinc finger protein [Nitrospinota bacterium]|nr:TraR/DksA C4-type zinc finger protein [Nitrospinota bacterium]